MGDQRGGFCVACWSSAWVLLHEFWRRSHERIGNESFIACVAGGIAGHAIVLWWRSPEKILSKSFIACLAGGIAGRILAAEMREDWEQVGKLNSL